MVLTAVLCSSSRVTQQVVHPLEYVTAELQSVFRWVRVWQQRRKRVYVNTFFLGYRRVDLAKGRRPKLCYWHRHASRNSVLCPAEEQCRMWHVFSFQSLPLDTDALNVAVEYTKVSYFVIYRTQFGPLYSSMWPKPACVHLPMCIVHTVLLYGSAYLTAGATYTRCRLWSSSSVSCLF